MEGRSSGRGLIERDREMEGRRSGRGLMERERDGGKEEW